jgi:hypothetical protein
MEGRFEGEASLDEVSVAAGKARCHFAYDAAIKASWKRMFAPIREMLAVERLRQVDDGARVATTGVPENLGDFIEAYSPILQWLRGRD